MYILYYILTYEIDYETLTCDKKNCLCSHFSDGREWVQQVMWIAAGDSDKEDSSADQEANKWRCNSGDLNCYRPPGLPSNLLCKSHYWPYSLTRIAVGIICSCF